MRYYVKNWASLLFRKEYALVREMFVFGRNPLQRRKAVYRKKRSDRKAQGEILE